MQLEYSHDPGKKRFINGRKAIFSMHDRIGFGRDCDLVRQIKVQYPKIRKQKMITICN